MLTLSIDSFTGFSTAPLRVATALGVGGRCSPCSSRRTSSLNRLVGNPVPGWASTVVIVVTMGAIQLLCLGLLGEYVGRMYTQMQGRPAYYVAYDSLLNVDEPHGPPHRRASGRRNNPGAAYAVHPWAIAGNASCLRAPSSSRSAASPRP